MPDNSNQESSIPQKGGTPVNNLAERGMGWKSKVANTSTGIAVAITGIASSDGSHALAQTDISSAAQTSSGQVLNMPDGMPSDQAFNSLLTPHPDAAPTSEQVALGLDQILAKSLIDKDPNIALEKLKKNPVDIINSTQRVDFNGDVTAKYFLVKDKVGINRVFFRTKQADGTFSETKLAGNVLPMENPKDIAVDSLGNILVVGQKTKKVSSPPGMAFLRVNSPLQFEDVSIEGYDNKYGDITRVISTKRPGTFLVNFGDSDASTVDGIKIATLNLQASQGAQTQARLTNATILLKDTSLNIEEMNGIVLFPPADFQAQQEDEMSFFGYLVENALYGVVKINKLNLDTAIAESADQLVPQIGRIQRANVVDAQKEILAVNPSSADFFVFNPTTEVIDLKKSFNYRKLVEGNKRFPEAYGGGVITGMAKVGNRYIASVSYGDNQGKSGTALFDWGVEEVDIDVNPELMNIQIIKDIEGGPQSMTLVKYNGQLALSIILGKKGKAIIPVSANGVPDVSKILYDDLGMQSNIVVVPSAPINYSSAGK